jgi:hypothetical protein
VKPVVPLARMSVSISAKGNLQTQFQFPVEFTAIQMSIPIFLHFAQTNVLEKNLCFSVFILNPRKENACMYSLL